MNGVMGLSYDVICERKSVCLDLRVLGISVTGKNFTTCLVCQAVNSQEGKLMGFFLGQKLYLKIFIKHNLC